MSKERKVVNVTDVCSSVGRARVVTPRSRVRVSSYITSSLLAFVAQLLSKARKRTNSNSHVCAVILVREAHKRIRVGLEIYFFSSFFTVSLNLTLSLYISFVVFSISILIWGKNVPSLPETSSKNQNSLSL